jgi:hypothetical protein
VSRVRPISPREALKSPLQRVARAVDRARQVGVRVGLRSRRVFLVWGLWSGSGRGDGSISEIARMELLPTPKMSGVDSIRYNPFSAGQLPEGSVRVEHVSARYTEEQLRGKLLAIGCEVQRWDPPPANGSFWYEVVEDGRGDASPLRQTYRLAGQVMRREGNVSWSFDLERASEDANPVTGASRFAELPG